jgi:hypothetical protein
MGEALVVRREPRSGLGEARARFGVVGKGSGEGWDLGRRTGRDSIPPLGTEPLKS